MTGICTCANINNGDYYPSGSGLVSLYCLGHFVARPLWTGVKSTSFSGCVCVFGGEGGPGSLNLALPHNVSFQLLKKLHERVGHTCVLPPGLSLIPLKGQIHL